ncbi:CCHC-type domain-containing protein [Trichonephila clavipes]|nr:CCHC-type domain-containing protein [Trichonephila clavipes]
MAFLGKGLKVDLQYMATEMEVEDVLGLKVMELRRAIVNSKNFDEEFCREFLNTIIEERKRKEEIELAEKKRKEEIELAEKKRKEEIELAEKKRKEEIALDERKRKEEMELAERKRLDETEERKRRDEMDFELHILPSEIVGLIAREPEKDAADYEFVKKLLLQRFKLSPEKFRQLFVKHQKNPDGTWKDFYYEIRNFCEEWLNGLDIQTFEDLKDLLITDQVKKKVPSEVREHFLDEWAKIKTPRVLVEKLDEYEDVHGKTKRPAGPFFNKERSYRRTMPLDTRGPPSQVENRNKEGMANRRYFNHFTENSHQAHYNQHRITPKCYTCGKEGHFAKACQDKSINKQNSPKNKFPSPVKVQSNVVQAEEDIKNIVTAKMDTPGSMCNFLAENIDRLKTLKVKCLDVVLNGTVDSGAQISVVRADLVKDIESTGEGKIKLISALGIVKPLP